VKLAVVVQRYGADINGGAELHARYVAERLSRHGEVEVVTTCARDYVTWRNERPAGADEVNGIPVRRFPVRHERRPEHFGRLSRRVFEHTHSVADELAWLESEGPASPALVNYLSDTAADRDFVLFFSYRYYHAWHGARRTPGKAILVPTAERDPAVALAIFGPMFRGVRAVMYNSHEERAMIHAAAGNQDVPGVVVGVGSEVPARTDAARFRSAFGIKARSPSTSAASTRTRAAGSSSTSFNATPRRSRAAWISCSSAARSCRSRRIPASITSASSPIGTSSTRSRLRTC